MNLIRFITISALLLALATNSTAQQIERAATVAPNNDATSSDEVTGDVAEHSGAKSRRRSATAHLFTPKSLFVNEPETPSTVGPSPQVVDEDKWQFQLTPYLWIAGISGRAGVGALVVNVDSGITSDNVKLNFGFMGTLEARKNRLIILTDLQYSNLGTERPTPGPLFNNATADFKTFILDPEVGYRVVENPEKGAFLDVLGGIRYWHLETDLTFTAGLLPPVTVTRSKGWVDAVGGIRGRAHLTKRVFLTGKADLGGGGSEFTYQLFGGAGVLVGKRYALIAAYRHLSVDYNRDGFLFDMALHGPVFGFGIKF